MSNNQQQQQHQQSHNTQTHNPHPERHIQLEERRIGSVVSSEPLITAGAVGLIGVLGYGLYKMGFSNDSMSSNRMMKFRVIGQAGVLGLVLALPAYHFLKDKFTPPHNEKGEDHKYD